MRTPSPSRSPSAANTQVVSARLAMLPERAEFAQGLAVEACGGYSLVPARSGAAGEPACKGSAREQQSSSTCDFQQATCPWLPTYGHDCAHDILNAGTHAGQPLRHHQSSLAQKKLWQQRRQQQRWQDEAAAAEFTL